MASKPLTERPDPDLLLARARQADEARARGRLRIYFGASAGVGKTYAMLLEGRRQAADGRDVVVGLVETHGRVETAALITADAGPAPTILPRARWTRDGRAFEEFDLDAALARRPQLILVDELAHSNAEGSRHPKRWQDVDELLGAGIDVFTTLNVQHLESLNDVVGGITGIKVRETVPDTFFDRATEVVLVDIAADELLKRLAAGKVYLPAQADHAARHFFRKGNLIALREIALRRTADRVEGDVQAYRDERAIDRVWSTEAALLCCVGPDTGAERVVRAAARLAGQLDVAWEAIYVETPRLQRKPAPERERILKVLTLAQQLGASTAVLAGSDVAGTVVHHARQKNLSRLVFGRSFNRNASGHSMRPGWLGGASLADRIAAVAPEIDLLVVGGTVEHDPAPLQIPPPGLAAGFAPEREPVAHTFRRQRRYLLVAAAMAAVTLILFPFADILHPTNIAMLYLLTVTIIAMRAGRGPAVFGAVAAVSTFDFFFVPPRFSFAVGDVQYVVTLATMLTIALVIGSLASNLRYQLRISGHREERARSLYEIARDLSKALRTEDVIAETRTGIAALFRSEVHVLLPAEAGTHGRRLLDHSTLGRAATFEPAIAQWAYDNGRAAGAGTDTLPASPWLFLPLQTSIGTRGVLAVRPSQPRLLMIPEQRRLLETLAALVGTAIERVHYVEVAQEALVKVESERLRSSILSALSHDLRTPIASLAVATETLTMSSAPRSADDRELIDVMHDDVHRMGVLVENLLDMARIESGDVTLRRGWNAIEETIGTALASSRRTLQQHRVLTEVTPHLPLVEYDAVLIERVLDNLLENAAKYASSDATILVEADAGPGTLTFAVEDDGPGLPEDLTGQREIDNLFEKFTRGVRESSTTGVGLGLAICRAIVEAHGGTIAVDATRHLPRLVPDTGRRGFRVVVTLPRTDPPPVDEVEATPGSTLESALA